MKFGFAWAGSYRLLAVLIIFFASANAAGQGDAARSLNTSPLPAPTGHVNDYVGVFDETSKQQLETRLRQYKEGTNPQVELAVAVVRTTGDRPIFDYSLAVARGWGIGGKEDDNPSALLLVAIDDRKAYTQISRDLEDEIPDALAGSLQRQYLVPEFRQGNYAKAISDLMEAYIRTIEKRGIAQGTPAPASTDRERPASGVRNTLSSTFCCFLIVLVLLLLAFSSRGGGRGGGRRGGGGFGGGGSALPWIIGSIIANSASSSSSGWGGGGGWSSGGGGGGWGGFGGGGDFGGGGAGVDW